MDDRYGCVMMRAKAGGQHARFITGTDLLIDGGVIAAICSGEYQLG